MRPIITGMTLWIAAAAAQNLTPSQKDAYFRYLASLYATYYAPLAWKNQVFQFDALDLKPWLAKVTATTSDLDFYEVEAAYISSLNDTHVQFTLPSDFAAQLGFGVDLYDGVPLIDRPRRGLLPGP